MRPRPRMCSRTPASPPVAEARGRRAPLADAVPPVAPVVVPAGVDAEVLRSGLGRRVDERQEPVRRRVAHERVHVVVEDERAAGVGRHRDARGPPVVRELADGGVEPVVAERERDRDALEALARCERLQPGVVKVVRTLEHQGEPVGPLELRVDLPAPGAVDLHLPHDGVTRVRVDQRRDRDVVPGGPRRASLQGVRAPVGLAVRAGVGVGERAGALERRRGPAALPAPLAACGPDLGRACGAEKAGQAAEGHGGQHLQDDGRASLIPDPGADAPGVEVSMAGECRGHERTRQGVSLDDLQSADAPGVPLPPGDEAEPLRERPPVRPGARQRPPLPDGEDLDHRPGRGLLVGLGER